MSSPSPRFSLYSLVALLGSCTPPGIIGSTCSDIAQCNPGLFCVEGKCNRLCNNNTECDAGNICNAQGTCTTGGTSGPGPVITSVRGDNVSTGTITSGLRVLGTNLDQVTALRLLRDGSVVVGDLLIGTAQAAEISSTIPGPLAQLIVASPTGQFTIQAESNNGVARQAVTILKGDAGAAGAAGAPGPTGPAGTNGTAVISLPYTGNGSAATPLFNIANAGGGAIRGDTSAASNFGADSYSGNCFGAPAGVRPAAGLVGRATKVTATGCDQNAGIVAENLTSNAGVDSQHFGLHATSIGNAGAAVYGGLTAPSISIAYGVHGVVSTAAPVGSRAAGVAGESNSQYASGVLARNSDVGGIALKAEATNTNGVALKTVGRVDLDDGVRGVKLPIYVMENPGIAAFCTTDGVLGSTKTGVPISCGCSCINAAQNGAFNLMDSTGVNLATDNAVPDLGGGCYCNNGGSCPSQVTYVTCIRSF